MSKLSTIAIILLTVIPSAISFRNNAASNGGRSCGLGLPIASPHSPYDNNNAVTITGLPNNYIPGQIYTVTISSGTSFNGWIIGSNPISGAVAGGGAISTADGNSGVLTCSGRDNHITNMNAVSTTSKTVSWTAPLSGTAVSFQAGVVFNSFASATLMSVTVNPMPTTTSTTTTTTTLSTKPTATAPTIRGQTTPSTKPTTSTTTKSTTTTTTITLPTTTTLPVTPSTVAAVSTSAPLANNVVAPSNAPNSGIFGSNLSPAYTTPIAVGMGLVGFLVLMFTIQAVVGIVSTRSLARKNNNDNTSRV